MPNIPQPPMDDIGALLQLMSSAPTDQAGGPPLWFRHPSRNEISLYSSVPFTTLEGNPEAERQGIQTVDDAVKQGRTPWAPQSLDGLSTDAIVRLLQQMQPQAPRR